MGAQKAALIKLINWLTALNTHTQLQASELQNLYIL